MAKAIKTVSLSVETAERLEECDNQSAEIEAALKQYWENE
jgi:hypothetical protein